VSPKNFELIILGGGAAAFAAATVAADLGAKTAMINEGLPLGGTCVNVGCIPTKHLLEVGNHYYLANHNRFRAIEANGSSLDFRAAIAEKDELIAGLRERNYQEVLESMEGVTLYEGRGRFISPHEVEVNGQVLTGEKFIIATGSSPRIVPFPGIERVRYLTNREALALEALPKTMIIIGAGPLAMEFAQMFSRFGTEVTVLARGPRVLRREEPEVSQELQRCLEEEGIVIHTNTKVEGLCEEGGLKVVEASIAGTKRTLKAEQLLMATGVVPNTADLGLEEAGVKLGRGGEILVDEQLRTSAEHIFAAGDVIGPPHLEAVAAKEGHVAAENALTDAGKTIDYNVIPHAVFTDPQVASVGLTEEEFSKRHQVCACRVVQMEHVPKAQAIKDTRGLIKMVIDPRSTEIVGVHIVASLAAEMIHEAVLAIKNRMTIDELIDTVHVFPTLSEGIKLAAQAFRRDVTKMSCCVE